MTSRDNKTGKSRITIIFFAFLGILLLVQCNDSVVDSPPDPANLTLNSKAKDLASNGNSIYNYNAPEGWRDLVVYAHGYVDPQKELEAPNDQIEGTPVSEIIAELGMAYATTSYPHNGLNGPEAVDDLVNLVNEFIAEKGPPRHVYLVGVSEGALISTLAVEEHPETFSGGLAGCGPVGNFQKQLNYFGDFHVLFNYFFPNIEVGSPIGVPETVINSWGKENDSFQDDIKDAVANHPKIAITLLNVANVPVQDPGNIEELQTTILDLLRYNVLATNDAIERLGGEPFEDTPFDNTPRYYTGTGSFRGDLRLNRKVERFEASNKLLSTVNQEFQTSGDLENPLVTTHTSGDQEIPYWHEPIYRFKAFKEGSSLLHSNLPILGRYGHCNFKLSELLTGFGLMVFKVSLKDLLVPGTMFKSPEQKREFLDLARKQGLSPIIRDKSDHVLPPSL
ncbi:MAG: alpha/beta hydrolase [Balneolaceae bacterium]|jgi:pimeloyl-ACP methyl ester carboxylesterase